ncbi:carbonic anhydrase 4b [Denticeps clupeoides]|uniref:carbonic anhydrase 4b n=1 Tax=Denticeps clupeoides TaxID=299321 RepID=UPI0010A3B6F9|nr:carbonic anhydrase 4-like [Denticeps clupeoides]
MRLPLVLSLLLCSLGAAAGAGWCYDSQFSCGDACAVPDNWTAVAAACGGSAQSPINIVTSRARSDGRLGPLTFTGYQLAFHGYAINNGHTVQINLPDTAKISGGHLNATYKAVQLHLHWGRDGGLGSEHTVDGERYPMELHVVHIKDKFGSLADALLDPAGVAVLGFFYEESANWNGKYDSIIKALRNITGAGTNTTLMDLSLDMLVLPRSERDRYFRYHGSLTTPGCDESVVWTIFQRTILLSKQQLSAFSGLRFPNGRPMTRTYRPVQPLNRRDVFRSGSAAVWASGLLLGCSVLTALSLAR